MKNTLITADYRALGEFRYQLRMFLHFSERAALASGLEPRQHQLLLAVKGLPEGVRPRITELANRLQIEHHSAVELANRLVGGGYARRERAGSDRREVLLSLTAKGNRILNKLSVHHRNELQIRGPALIAALKSAMQPRPYRRPRRR